MCIPLQYHGYIFRNTIVKILVLKRTTQNGVSADLKYFKINLVSSFCESVVYTIMDLIYRTVSIFQNNDIMYFLYSNYH